MTGGQGSYSMRFSHYESVPGGLQQKIVEAYQARKKHKED
jgi:elongation factor G